MQVDDIGVFIGIDVGKSEHWATALDRDGRRIHDRALPSDESRLRDLYKHLAEHGRVLVVVDQPATIGALAVAVAQDMGVTVGYLPGLSMRRIADLSPGNAKTDARDAAVIAQAARTMPHTLRAISTSDEDAAALGVLTGLDLDLARQDGPDRQPHSGLVHPDPPRPRDCPGIPLGARRHLGGHSGPTPPPTALRKAGKARTGARLNKHGARRRAAWAQQVCDALDKQTVTVAGTDAAGAVLPHLARRLIALHAQRADIAGRVEALAGGPPSLARSWPPCPASGSRPPPSSRPRPWARPPPPGPSRPPTPAWHR